MKYLKLFEELKVDTYRSAARGLSKLGNIDSVHKKRAKELEEWADTKEYRNLGTFNMNYRHTIEGFKKNPILPFYLSHIHFDEMSFFESCIAEKETTEYGLSLMCSFYNEKTDVCLGFMLVFGVIWEDGKFHIDKMKVDGSDTYLFSDRQSAVKFKKFLNTSNDWLPKDNKQDEDLDIKNQFMLYSTAEDYQKVIDSIKNINVNSLYQ